jgi:hypothetical protein
LERHNPRAGKAVLRERRLPDKRLFKSGRILTVSVGKQHEVNAC